MIKVILADDHALVRTGLKRLLDDMENITVIGEAENGYAAIAMVGELKPDVAIIDINMPGLNGIDTTEKLSRTYPQLKILIVTMHSDETFPQRLFNAGASAYLTKGTGINEISYAIDEVMAGNNYICNEVAQKMAMGNIGHHSASPFQNLSKREFQVLDLMIKGMKLTEISDRLCLSPKTVSTYRHRLFTKLAVENDVELAKFAIQHGFMEETPHYHS